MGLKKGFPLLGVIGGLYVISKLADANDKAKERRDDENERLRKDLREQQRREKREREEMIRRQAEAERRAEREKEELRRRIEQQSMREKAAMQQQIDALYEQKNRVRISRKCPFCSAPLSGFKGESIRCRYCDSEQVL